MFQTTKQLLLSTHLNFRVVSLFLRPEALFLLVHLVHHQQPQTLAIYRSVVEPPFDVYNIRAIIYIYI